MFHRGAVWRLVAHRYLSDARLTAGAAGRNHVSLLRTSQTLTTLHLSWHSSRGIGLTPCHYADRQSSWHDNELLQWGQSFSLDDTFRIRIFLPCNAPEQEVELPRHSTGLHLFLHWGEILARCKDMIIVFRRKKMFPMKCAKEHSEIHETCMGLGVLILSGSNSNLMNLKWS